MRTSGWARFSRLKDRFVAGLLVTGLPLGLIVTATGCGGGQKKSTQSAAGAVDWGLGNIDRSRCSESGKRVITADTNKDEKPDIWKFYAGGTAGGEDVQSLTCKQVDLNLDGRVDLVDHYGADGHIEMTEMDFDFDGKFDQTDFFSAGKKIRQERDMDFDGRPDHFVFFEAGKVVRIERDGNGDGRIDEWQYFEDGKLDRIGYDTTGSGKPDKWDRAAEQTAAQGADNATPGATEPPASAVP